VDRAIGLVVTGHVHPAHRDAPGHRLLPDRGADHPVADAHITRASDVDREDDRRCIRWQAGRRHGFGDCWWKATCQPPPSRTKVVLATAQ
jgi:hypothetical protein